VPFFANLCYINVLYNNNDDDDASTHDSHPQYNGSDAGVQSISSLDHILHNNKQPTTVVTCHY